MSDEQVIETWNAHDMKAFAELFRDDAEFVNVYGMWWTGTIKACGNGVTLCAAIRVLRLNYRRDGMSEVVSDKIKTFVARVLRR